jgi:MoxR-like ATPase
MSARKFFNPGRVDGPAASKDAYVYYNDDVILAVNVALATKRPLLLTGPSGSGKSSLARNVARALGRRYYEHVVTARTEPRDLLYRFDNVRRLSDAQSKKTDLPPIASYVEPGVLWWALNPDRAVNRGSSVPLEDSLRAKNRSDVPSQDAVVLIDEIDKADPDVPNGLLVPLGDYRFFVENLNDWIERGSDRDALIFITNNGERELPVTFIRRCVSLQMRSPNESELLEIARTVTSEGAWNERVAKAIASRLVKLGQDQSFAASQRWSTGEYLDAIAACSELKIDEKHPQFDKLLTITLEKAQPTGGSE